MRNSFPRDFPRDQLVGDRAQRKVEGMMEFLLNGKNHEELEEFLQDLLLHATRPEEIDSLLQLLRTVQRSRTEAALEPLPQDVPQDEIGGRFDVFKINAAGILRIGFVRGIDNAKKILPSLNAVKDGVYFLYDAKSSKIMDFARRSVDQ
jgi:hypothetical protein